ncbi:GDP-L-fucose synthase [bacterium]|nr:GDP-L-fucose synthase [bacterium]
MRKVFVAGHNGMVGRAICNVLSRDSNIKVLTQDRLHLDLTNQRHVEEFFKIEQPNEVILAAAKVGGIHANNIYPAEFIYENLQIQNNVIHIAHKNNVQKLLFLGSSCIYPKFAEQPIKETALLTGTLEPSNEPYAIAKISGIKMCESYNRQYGRDYRSVMPTNLYGPGDNYDPLNSHVIPGLIRRFHDAKLNKLDEVVVWGTGAPRREFLYIDDMAAGSLHIHNLDKTAYKKTTNKVLSHINIGSGIDFTIKQLAEIIQNITGFSGKLVFDKSKPDGTPRKLMDINIIKELGWRPLKSLQEGLKITYESFLKENGDSKG